jgi:hypothetical protein
MRYYFALNVFLNYSRRTYDCAKKKNVCSVLAIKHHTSTPSNISPSPTVHPALSSKVSSSTKLRRKSSKKNLLFSRINVRKVAISKLKQGKKRNRDAKLTIRSPTHTTFKTNVRHHRQRRLTRRKAQFPRCTSKTLSKIFLKSISSLNLTLTPFTVK